MEKEVRVRFAPSPTGHLHIGGARTALYNYLFAKHHGGKFILRIEDTDRERSTEEAVTGILEGLQWLGLPWDEGPYFQSQALDVHQQRIKELVAKGAAYPCYCTPEEIESMREEATKKGLKPRYNGRCRNLTKPPAGKENVSPAIRFRTPESGKVEFNDLIRGTITFDCEELDDLVIGRSDGGPTYNLSVVVDDITAKITHVIRGDDHINNTPRQILIYKALGENPPAFAHLPMILGTDKKKLSKRHNEPSALVYRDLGFLPQAVVNYLVRLGWGHGDEEVLSMQRLIEVFTLEAVGSSAAAINKEKLLWLNGHYIRETQPEVLWPLVKDLLQKRENATLLNLSDSALGARIVLLVRERSKTLLEMADSALPYLSETLVYDEKAVNKFLKKDIQPALEALVARLRNLSSWRVEPIKEIFEAITKELQIKLVQLAQPVRVCLTGTDISPGIYEVLEILGKTLSLKRLEHGLGLIS